MIAIIVCREECIFLCNHKLRNDTESFAHVRHCFYAMVCSWLSANGNRKLRIVAAVIIFDAVFGFFWPPMHRREVLAAGGGTLTDTLHIVWAFVHLVLMLLMIGFGAASFGKAFRVFSVGIVLVFIVFGILTTQESFGLEAGLPTPHVGIWERVNMGAYMLWVVVFAILLMRRKKPA